MNCRMHQLRNLELLDTPSCIFFPQGVFTSLNVTGAIAKAIIVIQNFGLRGVSSCSSLSTRQPYGVQRSQGGSTVPCLLL